MPNLRPLAAMALVTSSLLMTGCGGSGVSGLTSSSTLGRGHVTVGDLSSCMRTNGATVTTNKGEQEAGMPWHEEGEVIAHLRGVEIFMGVMTNERGARYQLGAGVGLAGGGPMVDGDPIEDHLGRVHNVSVLFSEAPDPATRRTVERCLGAPMMFDPTGL